MSLALLLIGFVVLVVGLPWLAAAVVVMFWAMGRCCSFMWPSRILRPPVL